MPSCVLRAGSRVACILTSLAHFHRYCFWLAVLCVVSVALNYQTPGVAMDVNNALFKQNGRCGLVLKPSFLLTGTLKRKCSVFFLCFVSYFVLIINFVGSCFACM